MTEAQTDTRMLTTYSEWSMFRNCRKKHDWRYHQQLVPCKEAEPLYFGSTIHECLKDWHSDADLETITNYIDAAYSNRAVDLDQRKQWHLATAMMGGYAKLHPTEEFKVVFLEKPWEGEILNPETGAKSRSFVLGGKVDGVVEKPDGTLWLFEHKTTSQLNEAYLERLWADFQTVLYVYYMKESFGLEITGVIYNILVKAQLKQGCGETQEEFETRRAALIAKSKSGKSSAKRKENEPDFEFQKRLAEKYKNPDMFHREELYVSKDQIATLQSELWELTQAYLSARRRGIWYQNTDHCFNFNRPCAYWKLCRTGGNPAMIEADYEIKAPHQELLEVIEKPEF